MKKELKIDWYTDGFDGVYYLDCQAICVAASAGYFNIRCYYFYCYLEIYFRYWDYFCRDRSRTILKLLGMKISRLLPKDKKEVKNYVIDSLNGNKPVILFPNYTALFYCGTYKMKVKSEENVAHGILVVGYDDERSVVTIADPMLIQYKNLDEYNKYIEPFTVSPPFTKLQITNDMLFDMWERSECKYIITIEKREEPMIENINELITWICNDFIQENECYMSWLIKNRRKIGDEINLNLEFLRRDLVTSSTLLFDVIKRFYNDNSIKKKEFLSFG
ncbi:MAG: BtrH N-terminal domain-containing protein, partial [Candidatus Cloacimonetes bacterium]|nr:BtrH N-terminal domain-containing protein [Candidatus Cloacimonadota bacterium]MDY0230694.1 BtrH N-terminal domain-containing protein [Candidatus Cloacimonadaceae bacterium]